MFIRDSIFRADFRGESILRLLFYPYARGLWLAAAFAAGFVLAALNSESAEFYFAAGALTTRFLPELIASMFARSS